MTRRLLLVLALFAALPARAQNEIDLNRATVDELDGLPGIGRSKAEAIVEWREEKGPFRTVADLRQLKGFGAATVRRLEGFVVVGTGPVPAKASAAKAEPPRAAAGALDKESPAGKLNVNLANEEELQELDGLSRANAKVIVAWRKVKGPFRTVADVARVPGVPAQLFETLKYFVTTRLDVSNAMQADLVALGISEAAAKDLLAEHRRKPLRRAGDLTRVELADEERERLAALLWFGD